MSGGQEAAALERDADAEALAGLGGAVAAIDGEIGADEFGPAPEAAGAALAGPDPAAEVAAVLGMVVGLASPLLPYLPTIYTDDKVQMLAAAYVPVARKYGWSAAGWLDQYGAEMALVAVALPLAIQTKQAHEAHRAAIEAAARAERAARAAPKVEAGTAAAAAPGGDRPAVTFGAVSDGG